MTTPLATIENRPVAIVPRVIGFVIFCIGIALIIGVFSRTYGLLDTPAPTVTIPTPAPSPSPGSASSAATANAATTAALQLGSSLTGTVNKLLVLLVMCIVGAILASIGMSLYFRAQNAVNDMTQTAKDADPVGPAP